MEGKAPTRILVVEDHANFRRLLCLSINIYPGMETCGSAESAREALGMIEDLNPDLILVDLSMPVMSGLDFLDEMRQDWPDMKCLILSGHAEEGYIKAAEEHGANGYILKAKPRAIMEAIERSLTENHFICPDNLTW